jgi:hypothetical protein
MSRSRHSRTSTLLAAGFFRAAAMGIAAKQKFTPALRFARFRTLAD